MRREASGDDDGAERHKRYTIYEYELRWNDEDPEPFDATRPTQTTRLKLVGQKTLLLNGEDVDRQPYLAPYYPDKRHCIIQGTQLLCAHGEDSISL